MLATFKVISLFLSAVTMSTALAHALEFPGKMRLNQSTYLAVQTIYYPGFTFAGIAEPLSAISLLVLMFVHRATGASFWWLLTAFIAAISMHIVFWVVTQPINRHWLRDQYLNRAGAEFFGTNRKDNPTTETNNPNQWEVLRRRWEYSHIARGALAIFSFISICIAVVR